MSGHPLDRPVWSALTTRQAQLAQGDPAAGALRFDPAFGLFAASADDSAASLAALAELLPTEGVIGLVEPDTPALPPGAILTSQALCVQMIAERLTPGSPPAFEVVDLGEADAPQMLALATLTRPGPFFSRTHQLGRFIGVKVDGALAAMAGERMRPTGFTEVSGVCTHPDHRGRGYAGGLMRLVAQRILGSGETAFLHAYADHAATIALYESLGFSVRRTVTYSLLARARGPSAG